MFGKWLFDILFGVVLDNEGNILVIGGDFLGDVFILEFGLSF